jgi:AmmeMemoRadiSam system protein A
MNLTEIARSTIKFSFEGKQFVLDKNTKTKYKDKKACFVTLNKNGNLRGCIGNLEAKQELWKDVQENAINAAFNDPRFSPLTEYELKDVKIEVSILSKPKKITGGNTESRLNKITKKMGIILKSGKYSATFLPQVWEYFSTKEEFLKELSLKAGLNKDAWKNAELFYYVVNIEKE